MYNPIMSAALVSNCESLLAKLSLQPIRLEPVFGPYPRNTHVRDIPEFGRQFSLAPVSRTVRGLFLNRPPKNACLSTLAILVRCTSLIAREQPRYALGQKATLPARNEIGVAVEFTAYHIKPLARFNQQNQPVLVGMVPHYATGLWPNDSILLVLRASIELF